MTRVNNEYSVISELLLSESVAYQQFISTENHSSMIHMKKKQLRMLIILKQLFSHIKHLIYF